jgi:hypothetical protein
MCSARGFKAYARPVPLKSCGCLGAFCICQMLRVIHNIYELSTRGTPHVEGEYARAAHRLTSLCDGRADVGEDMSIDAGQDNGTLRVTIREAAARLGVTEAAIRKRIQRGSLDKEMGNDGRVYVYLDLSQDKSHSESQVHSDPLVEELIEELRDRVAFLERTLERRGIEAERYQQIVAGLTQTNNQLAIRLRELEPPPAEVTPPKGPAEASTVASEEGPARAEPRLRAEEPQEPAQEERRSWWRRMFGS